MHENIIPHFWKNVSHNTNIIYFIFIPITHGLLPLHRDQFYWIFKKNLNLSTLKQFLGGKMKNLEFKLKHICFLFPHNSSGTLSLLLYAVCNEFSGKMKSISSWNICHDEGKKINVMFFVDWTVWWWSGSWYLIAGIVCKQCWEGCNYKYTQRIETSHP